MDNVKNRKKGRKSAKRCRCENKELLPTELKELLQKTQADFENYRKLTDKRIAEIREIAAKDIILQILPVLDNFELALKNAKHEDHKAFIHGIELIYSQLNEILRDNSIVPIPSENEMFDPHLHEALMKVDSDLPENMVVEVFQKGFTLNNQVIRHAKVKVSSGRASGKDTSKGDDREKQGKEDTGNAGDS